MTYAEIVKAQFAKHRGAVWSLRLLIAAFAIATYAPLIALNIPFWTNAKGVSHFPWFGAILNPFVFPLKVDLFFNLLMATLPLLVVSFFATKGRLRRWLSLGWVVLHLTVFFTLSANQDHFRKRVPDYPQLVYHQHASAFWPPLRHSADERQSQYALTPPFHQGELLPGSEKPPKELWPYFVLGADNLGNDVLTRVIYGTRVAFTVGGMAVGLYLIIGVILGSLAGFFGGWVDDSLMFLAQAVMTIPAFFLILFLISLVKVVSIYYIAAIIAGIAWPRVMRLVRAEFFRQREIDYVAAARALGLRARRVIFRHILPNSLAPVFVEATFGVAAAILTEATLSFLGFGDPSAPSWGQILHVGYENSSTGRFLVWIGGLAIFFTLLLLNVVGEALRDALDPRLRQ